MSNFMDGKKGINVLCNMHLYNTKSQKKKLRYCASVYTGACVHLFLVATCIILAGVASLA